MTIVNIRFVTGLSRFAKIISSPRLRCCYIESTFASKYSTDTRRSDEKQLYDVVISGGGMVGTAMAAALGSEPVFQGKKVLLLEAAPNKRMEKMPDIHQSRTCALSAGTIQLLNSFGAWNNICNMRVQPVKHMQIWDCCSDSMLTFHQDAMNDKPLAYIAENDVTLEGIAASLDNLNNNVVEVKYNARVKGYKLPETNLASSSDNWAKVFLEDGQVVNTRLLIGADGAKSLVRHTAQIHTVQWEYWQTAVVATLTVAENGENTTAWQRFLDDGPIALLPLSNRHCCLIWSTSHSHAKQLTQMSTDSFVDNVNLAFKAAKVVAFYSEGSEPNFDSCITLKQVPAIVKCSDEWKNTMAESAGRLFNSFSSSLGFGGQSVLDKQPRLPPTVISVAAETIGTFPLGLGHATHYVKPRVALIGDAAHRVHPLAGQGVNLGFGDVACLRQKLVDALYIGADVGSLDHLLSYETERQRIVVPMMAGFDGLNRIYSNHNPVLVLFRSIGCQAVQTLAPIKDLMMKFAMN